MKAYIDSANEILVQRKLAPEIALYADCDPSCPADCINCVEAHTMLVLSLSMRCIAAFPKSGQLNKQLRNLGFINPFLGHGTDVQKEFNFSWCLQMNVEHPNSHKITYEIVHWNNDSTSIGVWFWTPSGIKCREGCHRKCKERERIQIRANFNRKTMLIAEKQAVEFTSCSAALEGCDAAHNGLLKLVANMLKGPVGACECCLAESPLSPNILEKARIQVALDDSQRCPSFIAEMAAEAAAKLLVEEEASEKSKIEKRKEKKKDKKMKKKTKKVAAREAEEEDLEATREESVGEVAEEEDLEAIEATNEEELEAVQELEDVGEVAEEELEVAAEVANDDQLESFQEDAPLDVKLPAHLFDFDFDEQDLLADKDVSSVSSDSEEDSAVLHLIPICLWQELDIVCF